MASHVNVFEIKAHFGVCKNTVVESTQIECVINVDWKPSQQLDRNRSIYDVPKYVE